MLQMNDEAKYQSILWYLVTLGKPDKQAACCYIRALDETSNYKSLNHLSSLSKDFEKYINSRNPGGYERISTYQETELDQKIATQAFIHYHSWAQTNIVKTLNPMDWLYYHTIFQIEKKQQ